MMNRRKLNSIGTALAAMFLAGCGGGGGTIAAILSQGTTSIGAGGGTAATTDGRARAVFPAGVFAGNTSVTITGTTSVPTTTPAGKRLVTDTAYTFGPSGNFSQPVNITLQYASASLPSGALGSSLQIYKVVGADWQPVANSVVDTAAKTVTAPVSDFSTYGVLANNQFAGSYSGTFAGNSSGTWQATVDLNGQIIASSSDGFQGTGAVTFTGAATIPLNGSGTSQGYIVTFNGTFTLTNTGGVNGTGGWVSSSGFTGTWIGARTGP